MKRVVFISLLLLTKFCFSQIVEKDVIESGGVENNITATTTGMYEGTKSEKARALYEKAIDYSRNKDYKNAEKFYLKAIKEDSKFVEAYDNLGRVYRRVGELDKAEHNYLKSIELYPNGIMAHQNLAVVYGIKKDYDKAANEYEEILRISPNDAEGFFGLANSYMMQSKFDKALENSKKALKIYEETNSHHLSDGYYLTGLISYYNKNKKEAKKYLGLAKEKGVKIHPELDKELFPQEGGIVSKEEVIKKYKWLLKTPLGSDSERRQNYSAFLIKWMTESTDVSIELSQELVPYMTDCTDCLLIFMGGWTEYTFNAKKYDKVKAGLAGTESVIEFYLRNKEEIGVNKDIEAFIKLKNKNNLKNYIKKNL